MGMFDDPFVGALKEYSRAAFDTVEDVRELAAQYETGDLAALIGNGYAKTITVTLDNGTTLTITRDTEALLTVKKAEINKGDFDV